MSAQYVCATLAGFLSCLFEDSAELTILPLRSYRIAPPPVLASAESLHKIGVFGRRFLRRRQELRALRGKTRHVKKKPEGCNALLLE